MRTIVDFCLNLWDCFGGNSGGGGGPSPAPEISAHSAIAAIALLLSVAVILYRRMIQED
jgi:hypothetical protein